MRALCSSPPPASFCCPSRTGCYTACIWRKRTTKSNFEVRTSKFELLSESDPDRAVHLARVDRGAGGSDGREAVRHFDRGCPAKRKAQPAANRGHRLRFRRAVRERRGHQPFEASLAREAAPLGDDLARDVRCAAGGLEKEHAVADFPHGAAKPDETILRPCARVARCL